MAELLLEQKVDDENALSNIQDNQGNTPLLYAAQHGHYPVVQILLDQQGTDPFLANHEGLTALMAACRIGNERVVFDLIQIVPSNKRKQFINQQDIQKRSALHHLLEGKSSNMHRIGSILYNIGINIDR